MPQRQKRKVIVPLVTPSNSADFVPLINHVVEGGIQDLVLFGTTGEGEKIDLATKKSIITNIVPHFSQKANFYIGLMCSNIEDAMDLANFCHHLDFAGALLPPHLYGNNTTEVVLQFLTKTPSKFILYNPPGANPLGEIIYNFDESRIIGLKDSSGDLALMQKLTPPNRLTSCKIYYGREYLLEKALELDIDGIFPGTGNINPQLLLQLCHEPSRESLSLFSLLKEKVRTSCPESYVQGLKINLKNLGIIS